MANVSREDVFDLLEDVIAAMEQDLAETFSAGDVTLTTLKGKRDQYGTLLTAAGRKNGN